MTPDPSFFSRRDLARLAGSAALCGLSLPLRGVAQSGTAAGEAPAIPQFNRFPRMVHEYYVRQVRRVERRASERKAALSTKAEAEAYVADVRQRIARAFAPMPTEKTPLNPRVVGILERDGYTVEKIIFESRPKFYVTAHLYLPEDLSSKVPGVVGSCGHALTGKNAESYQAFAQGLARLGTACLIFDPIGQGERSQYLDEDLNRIIGSATREHNQAGNQMELVGEFLGSWRAWDGIRALDYLLTREEIDTRHLGITGNSGGGTMTTWLLGLEDRWTMGAPACFVTTWRRNLENELPQDNEQCPPRSLALGLDHDDYLAAIAPKPVIILAKEQDYFDVRGSEEAYERLRHLYRLLDAEENIQLFTGPTPHGFSQENREAMYRFFNSVTGASDAESEPELTIDDDETLWCTPRGQVGPDLGSRTVFHFTEAKAGRLKARREAEPLRGEALREAVASSLRLPPRDPDSPPDYRILRARGGDRGYPQRHWIHYAVESEPGMHAVCTMLGKERLHSRPPRAPEGGGRVLLWIANRSADLELREDPVLRELIETEGEEVPVFACDVRGVGESLYGTTVHTDPYSFYGPDYFYAAYANMLARPYLGGKTHDVLRVLDFLAAYGWSEVHLAATGYGCLPGGLAALLDERVVQTTLHDCLESWHSVATDELYEWPLSHMLFGVLRHWDLPEVWAELAG